MTHSRYVFLLVAALALAGRAEGQAARDPKAAALAARASSDRARAAAKEAAVAAAREKARAITGDFRLYGRNGALPVVAGGGESRMSYTAMGGVRPITVTFEYVANPAATQQGGFFELANNTRTSVEYVGGGGGAGAPARPAGWPDSLVTVVKEVRFKAPPAGRDIARYTTLRIRARDGQNRERMLTLQVDVSQPPPPPPPAAPTAFGRFVAGATTFNTTNAYLAAAASALADKPALQATTLARYGFTTVRSISNGAGLDGYIASNDAMILIVFRGTDVYHLKSLLADVNVVPAWGDFLKRPLVYVHSGFKGAFDQFQPHIRTFLDDDKARTGNSRKKVWIVGHSLGGAMATMAAAWLSTQPDYAVQGVFTMGAPSVGSPGFRDEYNARLGSRHYRIINQEDPVSRALAPPAFAAVGQLHYIHHDGTHQIVRRNDLDADVVGHMALHALEAPLLFLHDRHHLEEYFALIEGNVSESARDQIPWLVEP